MCSVSFRMVIVVFSSPEGTFVATILTLKVLRLCIQTRSGFRLPHNTRKIVRWVN